ncbi:hypothetical protein SpCBS45565_g03792 [Spizellomyces sp. 'palustris']|nr:hypothetical protein SpCBS45565_g03792 [Spizellomyces sp. 'palustris']
MACSCDDHDSPAARRSSAPPADYASRLPMELLDMIVWPYIPSSEMRQLRLLNSRWAHMLAPRVFHSLKIRNDQDLHDFAASKMTLQSYGRNIQHLTFAGACCITDEVFNNIIEHTPNIESLNLSGCLQLSAVALTVDLPQKCPTLVDLKLGMTAGFLSRFERRSARRSRFRRYSHVFDHKPSSFQVSFLYYGNLTSLDLFGNDFALKSTLLVEVAVVFAKTLKSLSLSHCSHVSGLMSIVDLCGQMENLDLSFSDVEALELCYVFKKRSIFPIRQLNLAGCSAASLALSLYDVHVTGSNAGTDTDGTVGIDPGTPPLQVLDLGDTKLDNSHLLIVAIYFPYLTSIYLRGNWSLTHATVARLIRRCKDLSLLDVTDCSNVGKSILLPDLSDPVSPPPLAFAGKIVGRHRVLQVQELAGENLVLDHLKILCGVLTLSLIVLSGFVHVIRFLLQAILAW